MSGAARKRTAAPNIITTTRLMPPFASILPTIGPMLLRSLTNQDMFLAGAIVLIYCLLAIIGTLVSDILLAWLDPRIRMES